MKTYYVGMDVHRASIMIVVLNGAGKVVMQSVIETGAERVRGSDRPNAQSELSASKLNMSMMPSGNRQR